MITDVVKKNNTSLVKIKGLPGRFKIPSDTIKKNDIIPVVFMHR